VAFDVYPVGAPVEVAAGGDSDPIDFTARIGPDPPPAGRSTIFVRLVTLGAGADLAHTTDIGISADAGAFVTVADNPSTVDIPDVSGQVVANADRKFVDGVSFVRIRPSADNPGAVSTWRLRITNNHTKPIRFTFVVADNDAETRQPWIDVGEVPKFDIVTGSSKGATFEIANRGTGQLRLADAGATEIGAGFGLSPLPATVEPNSVVVVQVNLKAGAQPSESAAAFAFTSNDTGALLTAGHNRQLRLAATVRAPLWATGDILVVDSKATDGSPAADRVGGLIRVNPGTGAQTVVSAGQLLRTPVGVAVEPTGHVVIADAGAFGGNGGVIRVDRITGAQAKVSADGHFVNPTGIAVLGDGSIIVADSNDAGTDGKLVKVSPTDGQQSLLTGAGALKQPIGVALEANGGLVVLDIGVAPAVVVRLAANGTLSNVAGGTIAANARGIAVAPDRGILVVVGDGDTGAVLRIDPDDGTQKSVFSGQFLGNPTRIALRGTDVIVTDLKTPGAAATKVPGIVRLTAPGSQAKLSNAGLLRAPLGVVVVPPRAQ
jgi:hypothetical protein